MQIEMKKHIIVCSASLLWSYKRWNHNRVMGWGVGGVTGPRAGGFQFDGAGDEQMNRCWMSAEQLVETQLLGFWTSMQVGPTPPAEWPSRAPVSLREGWLSAGFLWAGSSVEPEEDKAVRRFFCKLNHFMDFISGLKGEGLLNQVVGVFLLDFSITVTIDWLCWSPQVVTC